MSDVGQSEVMYPAKQLSETQLKTNLLCVVEAIRRDPVLWQKKVNTLEMLTVADWIWQSANMIEDGHDV